MHGYCRLILSQSKEANYVLHEDWLHLRNSHVCTTDNIFCSQINDVRKYDNTLLNGQFLRPYKHDDSCLEVIQINLTLTQ